MANVIQILIEAKDNASAKLQGINQEIGNLLPGVGSAGIAMGVAGVAIAALGTAAVAASNRLKALGSEAEALQNLAAKTGTSASLLQGMAKQLEDMGIQSEALGVSLRFLQKHIADNDGALAKYGITAKDSYGALMQLADLFQKMPDGPQKTAAAMELLGARGGQTLIPFLNQGSSSISIMTQNLRDMGAVLDDQTLRQLAEFDDQNDKLHRTMEGLGTQLSLTLLPLMRDFTQVLQDAADNARKLREEMAKNPIANGLQSFANGNRDRVERQNAEAEAYLRSRGLIPNTSGGGVTFDTPDSRRIYGPAMPGSAEWDAANKTTKSRTRPDDPFALTMRSGGAWSNFTSSDTVKRTDEVFANLGKSLEKVTVPALKLTDSGQMVANRLEAMAVASERMSWGVTSNIENAINNVVSGTQTIGQAFGSLMQGILQSILSAAAEMGIGIGLSILGTAIGGPVGTFIGGVGGKLAGTNSLSPSMGGNTYVIQSINSKDTLDALVSSTGSFRSANSRISDVAMAAA